MGLLLSGFIIFGRLVVYLVPKPSSQNDSEVHNFKEMKFRAGRGQSIDSATFLTEVTIYIYDVMEMIKGWVYFSF